MQIFLIGIAGMIGALLRYGTGIGLQQAAGDCFPFGTLAANWAGCLALSWFNRRGGEMLHLSPSLRNAVGAGLIGSFTTFSTFSVETVEMAITGRVAGALLYILASIWGGFFFAWIGWRLGSRRASSEGADSR
ncbi:fluoride efflux transporter FluC [Salinithrix halophila]|uniref:Fluoride-specific ion channel FluC n=1 Tax=Salinithrix halophila TaxID=1485204 RepID=A0ABV8JLU3_9BACL